MDIRRGCLWPRKPWKWAKVDRRPAAHPRPASTILEFPKSFPVPEYVPKPLTARIWAEEGARILEQVVPGHLASAHTIAAVATQMTAEDNPRTGFSAQREGGCGQPEDRRLTERNPKCMRRRMRGRPFLDDVPTNLPSGGRRVPGAAMAPARRHLTPPIDVRARLPEERKDCICEIELSEPLEQLQISELSVLALRIDLFHYSQTLRVSPVGAERQLPIHAVVDAGIVEVPERPPA